MLKELLSEERLVDLAAEHAVLVGLFQHGEDAYLDISSIVDENSFTDTFNQAIFKCIKHMYEAKEMKKFDQSSLIACADELGYESFFDKKTDTQVLKGIINGRVLLENVIKWAAKIRKLQISRLLKHQLTNAAIEVSDLKGTESIDQILGIAENVVFDFSSLLQCDETSNPSLIGNGVSAFLDNIENNPKETIGISSGMSYYDQSIGGGFRKKTVSLIGARPKALRYGSKVYTPKGPMNIENINIGDKVIHPFEGETKVTDVHDHPNTRIYRVEFEDGDCVECCGDHLWEVCREGGKLQNLTTKELIWGALTNTGEFRPIWGVRLPSKPLEFGENNIFGAYVSGVNCKEFIPKIYKNANKKTREDFLQGLFDRHSVYREEINVIIVNTCHKKLADDIKYMVQSLGGLCYIIEREVLTGKGFSELKKSYSCDIWFGNDEVQPFYDKHNCWEKEDELLRIIKNIKEVGCDNARCITVDKNDGLFMTNNFVITHNTGKSMLAANIGLHVAKNIDIPVLYLDTEMTEEDHWARMIPNLCVDEGVQVTIKDIETGSYAKSPILRNKVRKAAKLLEGDGDTKPLKMHYQNVSGRPFEEIISIMRRWVSKEVGFDENGNRKDCLIIHDYLKMMSGDGVKASMQEYQMLGFMTTSLHNFAVKNDVPVLSFIQLNRDGIDRESTDIISGSDRILWLVTNFTIYKTKTPEEIAETGPEHGNRKLVPISARHGEGLDQGDYINIVFQGRFGKIKEGETKLNLENRIPKTPEMSIDHVPFGEDV